MFEDFLGALSGDEFDEIPVEVEEFCVSPDYLDLGDSEPSPLQYQMIRATTQIMRQDTLVNLYGAEKGNARWEETFNESIFQLGKGSGKDFCSNIAVAYIVYVLLCMKSPQKYYKKPRGNAIAILNIAINAKQANQVFFKGFSDLITASPWFAGKYTDHRDDIEFDKNITVYSGHSEKESWEGYNTFMVILDEIAGFMLESASGNANAKTSEEIYKMYSASVTSRFDEFGKVVLLSFPRYKDDFIQQRYNQVVGEKVTVIHEEKVYLIPELGDIEGNFVEFEWEEDHITRYTEPRVYALKRPSWIMNPTKTVNSYTRDFHKDKVDALMRYACMPPDSIDGFFKDSERVEQAFSQQLMIAEDGVVDPRFKADPDKVYYMHVDLAQKVDNCAVAMAHVDKWRTTRYNGNEEWVEPEVVVDFIRYWKPSKDKTVDFAEVRDFITSIARKGFNIGLVTFDRWNSVDMMEYLDSNGMKTETLSVAKQHYTDMLGIVNQGRLKAPDIELVRKELVQLRVIKDKIDHPRSGSKDLADATCGAIYNAISYTPKEEWGEIEIETIDTLRRPEPHVIEPPVERKATEPMPPDLQAYLDSLIVL